MLDKKNLLEDIELVCFDLDDTLIRGIHSMMYLAVLAHKFPEFMRIDRMSKIYPSWIRCEQAKLALAKGLEIEVIESKFGKHLKEMDNIKETVELLRSKRIKTAVISTGPEPVVDAGCRRWGMDACSGSKVEVKDGKLTGVLLEHMSEKGKPAALDEICSRLCVSRDKVLSVGDGFSDNDLFHSSRRSAALNPFDERTSENADYTFFTNDLLDVFS